MLEGVLEIREQTRFVEELRRLKVGQPLTEPLLALAGNGEEKRERHILANHGSGLQKPLVFRGQTVDARGQDGLNRGRHVDRIDRLGYTVGASLVEQDMSLDQGPHALLDKQRVPPCPSREESLERLDRRVAAQQGVEQLLRALRRKRIKADLRVVCLAPPVVVAVLGPVADQDEQRRRGQALDEAIEERLRLGVDPVQILEDDEERLLPRFAQQQLSDAVEDELALLSRFEREPRRVVYRSVGQAGPVGASAQVQQRRQRRLQCLVECEQLARHLLSDLPKVVSVLDLEVALQQADHG